MSAIASKTETETLHEIESLTGFKSADDESIGDREPTAEVLPPSRDRSPAREPEDRDLARERNRERARRYPIASDVLIPATESLPDDQRAAIRWLHQYALENDLSLKELAQLIRQKNGAPYDHNTLYRVLSGKRDNAGLDKITLAIVEFRQKLEEGFALDRPKFIVTRLTKRLFQIFDAARLYKKPVFAYSDSQLGKTFCAEEYTRQNAGQTLYIRLPAGAGKRAVLRHIAQILGFDDTDSNVKLQERITSCFTPTMLLIFDEFHQVFTSRFQIETIEILREIADKSKCGMVFVSTAITEHELLRGKHKKVLAQLNRRSLAKIRLPAYPAKAELNAFAAAYGLPPATGEAEKLQTKIIKDEDFGGLGVWCTYLQAGAHVAAKRKQKMIWQHVLDGHDGLKKLEQMTDLND